MHSLMQTSCYVARQYKCLSMDVRTSVDFFRDLLCPLLTFTFYGWHLGFWVHRLSGLSHCCRLWRRSTAVVLQNLWVASRWGRGRNAPQSHRKSCKMVILTVAKRREWSFCPLLQATVKRWRLYSPSGHCGVVWLMRLERPRIPGSRQSVAIFFTKGQSSLNCSCIQSISSFISLQKRNIQRILIL